jgi:acyl phosphate:glycerol-3-phosphate acyltransferase
MIDVLLATLIGLALGSIPFGLLLTRAAGLGDIRAIGSGNIGATNVLRTGNRKLAAATLVLDALKGTAAVWLAVALLGPSLAGVAAVAAVIAHCHPPWLGFQGGKGVATALGALLGLGWGVFLAAAAAWLVAARLSRISSVGALSAMAVAPLLAFLVLPAALAVAVLAISLYVTWRHRPNIARLLAGTEPRIGERR